MSQLTKLMLQNIRTDLNELLKQVEDKYDLKISIGAMTYSDSTFSTKLTAVSTEATGNVIDGNAKWQSAFLKYARSWGLSPTDLGKEISVHGLKYKIVGARPKAADQLVLQNDKGQFVAKSLVDVKYNMGLGY